MSQPTHAQTAANVTDEQYVFDLPRLFLLARSASVEQHIASLIGQGSDPNQVSEARLKYLMEAAPRKVMFAIARLTEAIELLETAKHSVRDLKLRGKIDHLLSGALSEADIAKLFPAELFPPSIEAMTAQINAGLAAAAAQGVVGQQADAAPSSSEPTIQ